MEYLEKEKNVADMFVSVVIAMLILCVMFGLAFVWALDAYSQGRQEVINTQQELEEANSEIARLKRQSDRVPALEADIAILEENNTIALDALEEVSESVQNLKDHTIELMRLAEDSEMENKVLREYYRRTTGMEIDEIRMVDIEATKYTNAEGWFERDDPNYGMTASGIFTSPGVVAAPDSIPFGTQVMLARADTPEDQNRVFKVADRGSAIIEDEAGEICIDIWIEEHRIDEAFAFGRQHLQGFLIIPKEGN